MLKYNNLKYLADIFTGLSIKVYSIGDIVSFVPSGFVGGGVNIQIYDVCFCKCC